MPTPWIVTFEQLDSTQVALAGGKGAHLAALARLEGIRVPPGFVITTDAFTAVLRGVAGLEADLARLEQRAQVAPVSASIRARLEAAPLPEGLSAALAALGPDLPYAVRSSATAEDLPSASFAGQQDSFLNVVGHAELVRAVSRCWASLFTERAVLYRQQHGFDHRKVAMAVVVQQMVFPDVAGVLFTADPLSSNRRVCSIDASFGLGEALVSGLVNADTFKVRDGAILSKTIASKQLAVVGVTGGGTRRAPLDPTRAATPALTDAQVLELAALGRKIEAHFGCPQDLEWCLTGVGFHFVQSRPITTLFPLPVAPDDAHRVYLSVGHNQMMTDAMTPLGLSLWQRITPAPMAEAGSRLFVDVTATIASPQRRAGLLEMMSRTDPRFRAALQTVIDRGFIPTVTDAAPPAATPPPPPPLEPDLTLVDTLMARTRASLEAARRDLAGKTGPALFAFLREDIQTLRRVLHDPEGHQVVMAGIEATWWLNEKLLAWLGEKGAADVLTQSVPNNVTSEMGLALLDVADVIRARPAVVKFLERVGDDDGFLGQLPTIEGGSEVRAAIDAWLERYGMRGVGEIDVTRPRLGEHPAGLLPLVLGHVRHFGPGEAARRFEHGLHEAARREAELLERLRALPDGAAKAAETKRMIDRVRAFIGFREFPKYGMVSRTYLYRLALLAEAQRLVQAGVLREGEDLFFLRIDELETLDRSRPVDSQQLGLRREAFQRHQQLRPPRVLTSEGEGLDGALPRDHLPAAALVGLAVSAGVVEGRARVLLKVTGAALEPGDVLVTVFTDPSWTPLFVGIKGLITEVGGLMTHGAVIARELGLPAVVGVPEATRRIRDGQRVRVHGAEGYVELLD